ncbi:MAG: MarR family winged helix-turn-helix transcriptional regulator [Bacteroidota bacterium]
MRHPYRFIESLLPYIESYEQEVGGEQMDIGSFTLWLNKRVFLGHRNKHVPEEHQQSIESYISGSLIRMSKYAKHYAKMALRDSVLTSVDDFVLLVSLFDHDSRKKAEILSISLMEFPTGIGIINRLLKHGLIDELNDPDDRRSKRVRLTDKGRKELLQLFGEMRHVANIITGDLSTEDKMELLTMLEHLDRFHQRLYHNKHLNSLQAITEGLAESTTDL